MTEPDLTDPTTALGRCLIETLAYIGRMQAAGEVGAQYIRITGRDYPGREHWAVFIPLEGDETQGRVVDLTARQFSASAASPWDGDINDWLDDACEWLQDGLDVAVFKHFTDSEALWEDTWIREDIVPGSMTRPWEI